MPEDDDITDHEIGQADVLVLVYDVNSSETIRRLKGHWLPRISRINSNVPVLLAGNKIDLRAGHMEADLKGLVTPLCIEYKVSKLRRVTY